MNQELALEVLLDGNSVFLTGPAGTGKTYVLTQFIKLARSSGLHVAVTATTGLAASHLGGTTIHSWSGIGIGDSIYTGFVDHMSKTRREIIEKTDVLVIDEISMLHDYRLDMIDTVCRLVKAKPDVPFGGIQVVMSGDFFQLPPINRGESRQGGFVVNSQAWEELDPVICYLNQQFRQDDEDLRSILESMRGADLRRGHVEKLLARSEVESPDEDITELYTVNIDVDKVNERKLAQLEGDEYSYMQTETGAKNYVESLQRSILAPSVLKLKQGALVMAIRNSVEKKYVNGSLGIVKDFDYATNFPVVEFRSGKTVTMSPETWELRDGDKKRASISQVPLRLAWAITVHKSQGMTLDAAKMDLSKSFVEGMGYVALSRVRNLENLYLTGINRMALQISSEALRIDEVLRKKSARDKTKFEGEFANRKSKISEIIETAKETPRTWQDKLEKMREQHPNAYKSWSSGDDEDLKMMFRNGSTVGDLSKHFGRHEGSILKRLQKHFGEDTIVL
ncbi:AAA family ATPase [Candidatus Saccharibacteria bacterium]|nr:AAA family ATPase [Candidatus Saccharibacteria bacterium]